MSLKSNAAGQYVLNLMGSAQCDSGAEGAAEVLMSHTANAEPSADPEVPAEPLLTSDSVVDDDAEEVQPDPSPAPALPRRVEIQFQEDFGLTKTLCP